MPSIRKSIAEISALDISALIDDKFSEDETLEFKKTLSAKHGADDKWMLDQKSIGDTAKRDILAEVVAMANSYGGDLIVGVDETADKPPCAEKICPLPKCVELAHRIELSARDLIRPSIPMLSVRGILTEGDSGVVMVRIPKSRNAPHRLEMKGIEKECYKRVGDRTEAMTMREIQDLTFSVARGLDAIDDRFIKLHEEFQKWSEFELPRVAIPGKAFRVSAVPLSADLYIERVHKNNEIDPVVGAQSVIFRGKDDTFSTRNPPYQWRPVLRGTQAENNTGSERRLVRLSTDCVLQDLTSELVANNATAHQLSEYVFDSSVMFASIICAIRTIHKCRCFAGAQSVEFALELEIAATDSLPVHWIYAHQLQSAGVIPPGSHCFPRYQIGDPETWNETLDIIWKDFWNFIGVDAKSGELSIAR